MSAPYNCALAMGFLPEIEEEGRCVWVVVAAVGVDDGCFEGLAAADNFDRHFALVHQVSARCIQLKPLL